MPCSARLRRDRLDEVVHGERLAAGDVGGSACVPSRSSWPLAAGSSAGAAKRV